jgi:hypothetical protein
VPGTVLGVAIRCIALEELVVFNFKLLLEFKQV